MGLHIEPPEELRSFLKELNAGISVSPRNLPIQHLYATTFETHFSGCGDHEDFYQGCFEKAKDAIAYSWKKISEKNGGIRPRHLKLNYSVGRLPSEPHKYIAAWITQVSPSEYNIMFNEKNEESLKPYAEEKCTSIMSHETGVHVFAYSLGMGLSEPETERMNLEALRMTSRHKEADFTKRGSNYLGYII